jgi:hypothetical protein
VLGGGALVGLSKSYPRLKQTLADLATPTGEKYLAELSGEDACLPAHAASFANVNFSSANVFRGGNIESNAVVKDILGRESLLQNVSPLHIPVPKTPRFQWHGMSDTIGERRILKWKAGVSMLANLLLAVPLQPEREYVHQQCMLKQQPKYRPWLDSVLTIFPTGSKGADIRFVTIPGLDHDEAAVAGIPGEP